MSNALIVSTARTPLTKSWKGAFNMTHGATLGGWAVAAAVERAAIAMVCSPLEQKRLMVTPLTVTGRPAASRASPACSRK